MAIKAQKFNTGSLDFKWKLNIEANGTVTSLANVIDVYYIKPVNSQITSLDGLTSSGQLELAPGECAFIVI